MEARGSGGRSGRSRLPLAIAVAAIAAGAATFLLRPRSGIIEPAAVDAKSYFTAISARPRGGLSQRPAPDLDRRPGGQHGHAGAARLAPAARARSSGSRAGRSWAPPSPGRASRCCWCWSTCRCRPGRTSARSTSACRRRSGPTGSATSPSRPRSAPASRRSAARWRWRWCGASRAHWWAPASLVVIAFGVITIWLFPVVIDPIFNDFKKLPPGPTRTEVLELAHKAGVDVGEVYRGRREPPHDGRQRLRQRPRALEARRAVRQPAEGLPARRGQGRGRPRARATRSTTT